MDSIALTKKLMKFRTVEGNLAEIQKCAEFVQGYLKGSGLWVRKFVVNKKPVFFVCTKKTKKPKVLFLAHLDVVPASQPFFNPKIKGEKLYGRGSLDDKSSAAIALNLLKNYSGNAVIAAILNFDEEVGGESVGVMKRKGFHAPLVLVLDAGSTGFALREKGLVRLKVSANGKEAHSAYLWDGKNAIDKLIQAYLKIKKLFPKSFSEKDWKPTINLSIISGGKTVNKVPDYAEMHLDIRFTDKKDMLKKLKKIKKIKGIKTKINMFEPCFSTNSKNKLIKEFLASMQKSLHKKISFLKMHGATDGRYFASQSQIILLGPNGGHGHTEKEFVFINSVKKLEKALNEFVMAQEYK